MIDLNQELESAVTQINNIHDMKKFYALLSVIALSVSMQAMAMPQTLTVSHSADLPSLDENMVRKDSNIIPVLRFLDQPRRISADDEVIYQAPEGEVVNYTTTGQSYMAILGNIGQIPVMGFNTEMVYCDNGDVYWKNSITQIVANTYIKGTDMGDKIVFQLPQAILVNPEYPDSEGNATLAYAQRMRYDADDQFYYVDEEDNTVTLYKNEDGSLTSDVDGNAIIGMTTPEGMWYGYGNYGITMTPAGETTLVTPPDDLELETWYMISDYVGHPVELGFYGDDEVYFYMPVTCMYDMDGVIPEYWVKGTIEGDEIILPKQYIGMSPMMQCDTYFNPAMMYYDYEEDEDVIERYDVAVLSWDPETKTMKSDVSFAVIGGPGYVFGYEETPVIRWQPEEIEYNLPNPVIIDAFNYDDYLHYGVFAFGLPALNKEGYVLDPDYIYARLYVDGEVYEFTPEDYDIDEPMEWVPFLFDDGWDFHQEGAYHRFDIYFDGAETMGVQAKYDDGANIYYTDIVTTDLEVKVADMTERMEGVRVSGNDIIAPSGSTVMSVNGMVCGSRNLEPGVYLVRTSGKTVKVMVR